MQKIIAGILGAVVLGGCLSDNDRVPEVTTPEILHTRIHSNREIRDTSYFHFDTALYDQATTGFAVEPGERDLFEYYHREADDPSNPNDGNSEAFYFLVTPGTGSLEIDSSSFALHKPRYVPWDGASVSYGVVDSGRITITQTGEGRYRVKADVGFERRHEEFAGYRPPPERGRLKFEQDFAK
jgi:hypothetical protein